MHSHLILMSIFPSYPPYLPRPIPQMCCVHLYGLHVYCALVDLDSSGSPGVRPTPGLTSSTQVVCVCVRAYTSTHTPTTLTPQKIEKYTRQNPYLYPLQNTASHARNKRHPWTSWTPPPLSPNAKWINCAYMSACKKSMAWLMLLLLIREK